MKFKLTAFAIKRHEGGTAGRVELGRYMTKVAVEIARKRAERNDWIAVWIEPA